MGATLSVLLLPFAWAATPFIGGVATAGSVSAIDDAVILDNNATPLSETLLGPEHHDSIQRTKLVISTANIITGVNAIANSGPRTVMGLNNAANIISISLSTTGAYDNYNSLEPNE